jgi:DNA-directed RNA polymerase subunit M/transcription elongation factor TFIIS
MLLASNARAATTDESLNGHACELVPDRPIYDCPKCKELGMQFFAQRLDMPGREDFFYCCACGSTWKA